MAGYKDIWNMLRTGKTHVEITERLGLPPSRMLRLLQSKRLRRLIAMDMAIMLAQSQTGRIGQNAHERVQKGRSGAANWQMAAGNELETGRNRAVSGRNGRQSGR
jgi:hypothetical protein